MTTDIQEVEVRVYSTAQHHSSTSPSHGFRSLGMSFGEWGVTMDLLLAVDSHCTLSLLTFLNGDRCCR